EGRTKSAALRLEHFKWTMMIGIPTLCVARCSLHTQFLDLSLLHSLFSSIIFRPRWLLDFAHWALPPPDSGIKLEHRYECDCSAWQLIRLGETRSRGRLAQPPPRRVAALFPSRPTQRRAATGALPCPRSCAHHKRLRAVKHCAYEISKSFIKLHVTLHI